MMGVTDLLGLQFYVRICTRNAAPQSHGANFVRACVVEMQLNMSQEQFDVRIYTKKTRNQMEHPDTAPAFLPTVRTLQRGRAV